MPQSVIATPPGVLAYENFGFTNCVREGSLLFLSGVSALTAAGELVGAGDIEAQTVKTYENIEALLGAAGSRLGDIVQMTSFVVDLPKNGQGYVNTRQRILTASTYTSATIGVAALMVPGLLLEVQCVAAARG